MKALWLAFLLCAVSAWGETPTSEDTQWITELGGTAARNAQGLVTAISLRGTWVTDTGLRRLNRYSSLRVLDLGLTHITDGGMQEIKNLRGITDFDLYFAEYVTDEGVAAIKDWKRLKLCGSATCRWAFYDQSRNRSSRWCAMASCGNRQKAKRFRARAKSGSAS